MGIVPTFACLVQMVTICPTNDAHWLAVARARTDRSFVQEVPRLLTERAMSVSALARETGITQSHLSRVLRQSDYKTPSADLAVRVAKAFSLPDDYFPEAREGFVIDKVRRDPRLRDQLYDSLRSRKRRTR
jgi:transcriptional regulator with XRE-family HTH domain